MKQRINRRKFLKGAICAASVMGMGLTLCPQSEGHRVIVFRDGESFFNGYIKMEYPKDLNGVIRLFVLPHDSYEMIHSKRLIKISTNTIFGYYDETLGDN